MEKKERTAAQQADLDARREKYKRRKGLVNLNTLTDEQKEFVRFVAVDNLPPVTAARMTGTNQYKVKAHRWKKKPAVMQAIAIARAEFAEANKMTKQKVMEGFAEAIDMARMRADPLAMISGWREVGKMCGFYEPTKTEIQISVNGQVQIDHLNALGDAELLKLADESIESGREPPLLEGVFEEVTATEGDE